MENQTESPEKHLRQYYSKEAIREAFVKWNTDLWNEPNTFATQEELESKGIELVAKEQADELIRRMN